MSQTGPPGLVFDLILIWMPLMPSKGMLPAGRWSHWRHQKVMPPSAGYMGRAAVLRCWAAAMKVHIPWQPGQVAVPQRLCILCS